MNETIALTREVEAIQVPSGDRVTLPAGTSVMITQALGGSYTVHASDGGGLFRIQARDADALGQETTEHHVVDGPFEEEKVWEQLRNCYDPEIPLNIVDLGLIYSVSAADEAEAGRQKRDCENDPYRARLRDGSFARGGRRATHPHRARRLECPGRTRLGSTLVAGSNLHGGTRKARHGLR